MPKNTYVRGRSALVVALDGVFGKLSIHFEERLEYGSYIHIETEFGCSNALKHKL